MINSDVTRTYCIW